MKTTTKKFAWLLITVLFLMLAAACGPATPKDETADAGSNDGATTATNDEIESPTDTAVASDVAASTEDSASSQEPPDVTGPPEPVPAAVDDADYTATDSGLRYYDLVEGDGGSPEEGDIVSIAYSMWLEEGSVFLDSSRGQATDFILGSEQVFPGWNEGVLTMNEGGKRQLVIPSELALGEEGLPGLIPPNAVLVLEVELVSFRASPTPTEVDAGDFETTDSGLKIYDIATGDGLTPQKGDTVTIEFAIWLQEEMTYVAGSEDQGGEFSFALGSGQAFPGWEEGTLTMAEGGTRQLIIPPDLALGEQGVPGVVPPNATLVMEITLLSVQEAVVQTEVDEADYITTESGLKYYDIEVGDGPMPEAGQTVAVHYTGWLEDGTKFDSSLDRGQPFEFPLGQSAVIAGWDEGVATMRVGGKRQLFIPADLAYGDAATGIIPAGATLIFDVELLEIK